jgi:hypothetical protein
MERNLTRNNALAVREWGPLHFISILVAKKTRAINWRKLYEIMSNIFNDTSILAWL